MTDLHSVGWGTVDHLATSADTWRDGAEPPRVPAELAVPGTGTPGQRLRAWRDRHQLRIRRANESYLASRQPARALPVASTADVVAFVRALLRKRRTLIITMLALHALAAGAALVAPRLLGALIDDVTTGGDWPSRLNGVVLSVGAVVLAQALFTLLALRASVRFGQDVLAEAREDVVRDVLRLPLGRVESANSGDLVTRVTRDVSTMSESARFGLPEVVIAVVTTVLTIVALIINSPFLALPLLLMLPLLAVATARYIRRAPRGYIAEGATYSTINSTLTETVEGARTVEALGLQRRRNAIGDADIAVSAQAERYTMTLRNLLFVLIGIGYDTPLVALLLLGGIGYLRGWVSLGELTAATLYLQTLVEPLDRLIRNLDRLQVGLASTTRLLGIGSVPPDRTPGQARPTDSRLVGTDLRFAYRPGRDVLHGIDLAPRPGERLAIVGPSGSGKSTLGRLMAGINGPRTGSVRVGGVDLVALPLELLRTEVALVTQEHHVFVGTLRDNIVLAREDADDATVARALATVEATDWVDRLPERLNTKLGSGGLALTPGQAQQVALARLVLADPHTLVLDEATSLIDPRTARHLEGSMAALLADRTVLAIAHRLHTAHDADRIAVVIDGRIAEFGSHHELLDRDGEYARLWRAWTS